MSSFGLVWASLHRRPVRTYLTLFSVLVAFLLFTLLRTTAEWFTGDAFGSEGASRLVVTSKYSIIDMLPISQRNEILRVEGVEAVAHQTWFGGNYQDPSNFFPKFPVEPRSFFDIYSEFVIDPAQLDAFEKTRTAAVAPQQMMTEFGWQIGDKIPIEADIWPQADGNRTWIFDLVGSYYSREEPQANALLFHYDYFDEARGFGAGTVGWYTVRLSDVDRAPEVANDIDSLFENSLNPTKTATEDEFSRAFAAQAGDIGLMATAILGAVFFVILLLTANTMSQALRERIPELAVLKTLGFQDLRVALLVLGESVLLCLLGGLLGIGLAALLTPVVSAVMEQTVGTALILRWQTLALGAALAAGLGAVVGILPALAARHLTIAEALRR